MAAIEAAGSLERDAIRQALASLELTGSLLPGERIDFPAATHFQIDNPCLLVQNKPGGEIEIIYPPDAATGEAVVPRPATD